MLNKDFLFVVVTTNSPAGLCSRFYVRKLYKLYIDYIINLTTLSSLSEKNFTNFSKKRFFRVFLRKAGNLRPAFAFIYF